MFINLEYEANALSAPQSFRDGMQTAANILQTAFDDNITVNIKVSYGTFGTASLPNQNTSEGDIGYSGNGTEGTGVAESYSNLRSLLASHATSPDDFTSVNSLPNTATLQGRSSFTIGTAQGKALGVVAANSSVIDGQVGMGTNFAGNVLISGALHELTHAMGRIAGLSLDLFRFNEDHSGNHVFGFGRPATPAYFSIDGGTTDLADFGINSDPGDFLNPPNSNLTPNDPFNENVGNRGALTAVDVTVMDVLGFHRFVDTTAPTATNDNALDVAIGTSAAITQNQLRFDDPDDGHGLLTYTVVTAPSHGTLLRNGAAAAFFTQADIDNGLIAYREDGSDAALDSFTFSISDALGNHGPNASFQINIVAPKFVGSGDFDADADKVGDVLLQYPDGTVVVWDLNGPQLTSQTTISQIPANWHAVGAGDFNADGNTDGLLQSDAGFVLEWQMNGSQVVAQQIVGQLPSNWHYFGTGDFNRDGKSDVLWQSDSGGVVMWQMNGLQVAANTFLGQIPSNWHVAGIGDVNHDESSDILLHSDGGGIVIWEMSGSQVVVDQFLGQIPANWHFSATGDFNGYGNSDFLFRSDAGGIVMWEMNGTQVVLNQFIGQVPPNWHIVGTGDFNSDGKSDILWQSDAGASLVWEMNGPNVILDQMVGSSPPPNGPPTQAISSAASSGVVSVSAASETPALAETQLASGGGMGEQPSMPAVLPQAHSLDMSGTLLGHDQHFLL